jgi:Cu/Zn superoxide dismutase
MKLSRLTVPVLLVAVAFARPYGARADAGQTVVVTLNALNGSGEEGTATLKAEGAKTLVTIRLSGGSDIEQPAHFHRGNCQSYQPRPLYPLNDVVNGKSTTTVNVPIDQLAGGDLIVNIHKSYADIATQAACGISKS